MSEKIWKIFGIIGITAIVLAVVFLISFIYVGMIKPYSATRFAEYESTDIEYRIGYSPDKGNFTNSALRLPSSNKEVTVFKTDTEIPSRMIIKTGWLNLVVKDVLETMRKISKFIEDKGGWIVSSNIAEYEKVPSGSITVRIPAEKFEEATLYFRSLAIRVSNEKTQSQDITEEYVDLEARLKNLEASERQLLDLMTRTGKISEILEVQRELTNIRQQIEQIKGRMQYLDQSVKMSSITVNLALSEELLPVPPAEKWRSKYVLLQSWKGVLNFWKGFSYFLIRLIVWSQVWAPILILSFLFRRFLKRRKESKA